jgi:hypothetical protein
MKPLTPPPGTPSGLSDSLRHNLNMYRLAATAAGVSLLALAPSSEARIVYTKTRQVIGNNGIYPLDLNHDGVIDFVIQQHGSNGSTRLLAKGAVGNAVEGTKYSASALKKGAVIGSRQRFASSGYGKYMAVHVLTSGGRSYWSGQWPNVTNRYLGLRFQIDGKTHYGWARLSTRTTGDQITATLTGYAYETIAHKRIRAGQTVGEPESVILNATELEVSEPAAAGVAPRSGTMQPSSLGRLALGAQESALRRQP